MLFNFHMADMALMLYFRILSRVGERLAHRGSKIDQKRRAIMDKSSYGKRCIAVFGAVGVVAVATGVCEASPVTYDFVSGYASLSATSESGNPITLINPVIPAGQASSSAIALTGTQLTFDAVAGASDPLSSFQFVDSAPTTLDVDSGSLSGLIIELTSVSLTSSATGYSSSVTGANPYNFLANPIVASMTYSLGGTVDGKAVSAPSKTLTGSDLDIGGSITLGSTDSLQLNAVTLPTVTIDGHSVNLTADVNFVGNATPVPLPAGVWLFGPAAGLCGLLSMRKRRALA